MPGLASLLDSRLPAETVEVLRTAGELAAEGEHGASEIYLVGGSVRDLVLGRDAKDPDIVVVGNGPRFARALAERIGGTAGSVSQFGTAVIDAPIGRVDVATARSERYSAPAALPDVTPSGMHDDLRRRDFSVNAMAASLLPDSWGSLLDPYKGFSDCARGRIRFLHDNSFQDDPTRILRTVRYEVRLGFKLEIETAEALDRDRSYLDRLSSARILAELRKMLAEDDRIEVFRRAEELGVLSAISPALRVPESSLKALEHFGRRSSGVDELLFVACMTSSLTEQEAESLIERLAPDGAWQAVIRGTSKFREIAPVLESPGLLPSEVVELVERIPVPVLEVQRVAGPKTHQRQHVEAYLRRHREVRVEVTGDDLAESGVPRGPVMGQLLQELKTARLNGRIRTREEELELVSRRLPMLLSREQIGDGEPTGAVSQ